MDNCSETALDLESLDLAIVRAELLVNVVVVEDVLSQLLLISVSFSLSKHFLSRVLISLHHFDGENVIDFNIMGGEPVVQERGREHEVIPAVPELWVILCVEGQGVPHSDESKSGNDADAGHEIDQESRIVEGSIGYTYES